MRFSDEKTPTIDGSSMKIGYKPNYMDNLKNPIGVLDYTVHDKRTGNIVDCGRNLIVNLAKDTLAKLLGGDGTGKSIASLAVGTNSTAASPSDTTITDSFVKAVDSHNYPSTGRVQFVWSISSTEANGKNIWEFGLLSGDGSLFARRVRPTNPIYKDDEITIDGTWTIIL